MAATKPRVISSISADDRTGLPRISRKKCAVPAHDCSIGTYTFKYIRSMHSSSSVVCSATTSAALRATFIARAPVDGFPTGHHTAIDALSDYKGGFVRRSGTAAGVRLKRSKKPTRASWV